MRILLMILWLPVITRAQTDYPQGYFRNPLQIPMSLSGNFGELRPNHYHMGLDLRTNQRENLPVYAAAGGYIGRIKIEPGGFGRAIYIYHPNGYTTVYAHLNDFTPALETYIKQQQYLQESWRVQLEIPPQLFPVKKGDFIAYSGNTGGSQAPHLHFEIRRTSDEVNLNPLLFGLPLKDEVKPRLLRLALYDRTRSVFEQSPRIIALKAGAAGAYTTTPGIIKVGSPLVSFAVTAFDTHSGSTNLNGIYCARLLVNGEEKESFLMDQISYNDTRYLNAHIDYRYRSSSNVYLQHLSELPGYLNSIYRQGSDRGVIDISDGDIYDIGIEVEDTEGNTSLLKTRVQYDFRGISQPALPGRMFYPLMLDGYESENCEFYIGEKCLYDSVRIAYRNTASADVDVISDVHHIGDPRIPLHEPFLVRIRPDLSFLPEDSLRTVMQWSAGTRSSVQKVHWQGGWAFAHFRDFGAFRLLRDTTAPVIVPVGFADGSDLRKTSRITFRVTDNLPGVKNVRAELDGKWLRFTNDKGRLFIYTFDEKCPPGEHVLEIFAEDEAGNRTSQRFRFTR